LAKVENIQVEPEELQSETVRTVDALSQSLSEREARRLSDQRVYNNLMSNIMVNLVTERAQKRLRAIASGEFTSESETDIDLLSTGDLKSVELEAKLETTPEEQQVIEDILVPVEEVKLINEEKGEL
jgi:hypothetical protein